jgi:predicted N-acyltransferase
MPESLMIVGAFEHQELIAMALFFTSPSCLYGRYWGIDPRFEEKYPFLHFELCYYQGMDHCLAHRIPLFEAGAQGEHKLWRGFEPVTIYSAHHLKDARFFAPIKAHIREHNQKNTELMAHYRTFLPFS